MSFQATTQPHESAADAQSAGAALPAGGALHPEVHRLAIGDLGAHIRFWFVAVLGLALDLWSKDWAFQTLRQGGSRVLVPRVLEFQTMMNDGALFGIGSGQTTLFLIASGLALVLVFWMFARGSAKSWVLQIALGGILAGALGNMYDRMAVQLVVWREPGGVPRHYETSMSADGERMILREYPPQPGDPGRELHVAGLSELPRPVGYVRDFIKIPTKIFGDRDLWPWVFNVADMLLVGGVGILALRLWRERDPTPAAGVAKVDAGSEKA